MKLLLLDFDGVLCDSIMECLINSYNSFNIMQRVSIGKVYDIKNISPSEVAIFKKFRPLVRVAKEYYALWILIKRKKAIDINRNIRELAEVTDCQLKQFETIFFQERKQWMGEDIKLWLKHNPLFNGMKEPLLNMLNKKNVVIVSSKNHWAIKMIFENNGLSTEDDRIYGFDSGMDKEDILKKLKDVHSINYSDMFFLDDNLNNILKAQSVGICVFFASWGYSLENEKEEVLKKDIPFITLEKFEEWSREIIGRLL